jgi:thiol-disulfide isomerase/thioredoxin
MSILAPSLLLLLGLQAPSSGTFTGKLNDRMITDSRMVGVQLKPTSELDIPGAREGDRIYGATIDMFKQPSAPKGLGVALVEGARETFLFLDTDLDGRFGESERMRYTPGTDFKEAKEISVNVALGSPAGVSLPLRGRVLSEKREGTAAREFLFTPIFRVEGHVDIAGRKTLISLPFKLPARAIDVRNGQLGIDTDGDGKIETGSLSPEMVSVEGENIVLRAGDRFVSFEAANLESRTVTLRERTRDEYTLIEAVVGSPVRDFSFTDFEGKEGRLSDFRGKYVLLDFWGSWCKPCVTDVPAMKEAHEQLRDKGFEILGLDFEDDKKSDSVRPFLKQKAIGWRNATPESVKDLIEKRFRVSGFPTLILLDPDGIVLETRSNELRGDKLIPTLERFMKQPR